MREQRQGNGNMGLIEIFRDWLFGSAASEQRQDNGYGDLKEMTCGTFIKHRVYVFAREYQEVSILQDMWAKSWTEYTNAVIDGDQDQIGDLWQCMAEIDNDAAVMIEKIENYLKEEGLAA
jgi:hypothetical protein